MFTRKTLAILGLIVIAINLPYLTTLIKKPARKSARTYTHRPVDLHEEIALAC